MLFRRRHPEAWFVKVRTAMWPRRSWSRSLAYVFKRIIRITATPHAIAAGVAAGTVYLYFRGKDDLLVSIFERTMTEAIAEGRESVGSLDHPVDRLREIARLHLDRLGRDRALAIVFQVELRQSTKFMERFSSTQLREYLGIIRDVIADGQARQLFRPGINPTLAAKLFFGALDEMATNWILSRRRYSLAGEADAIVDLFVGGMGTHTERVS